MENGVAISKVKGSPPQSEGDLRIISKTPFMCKVYEAFVTEWILEFISPYLDPSQCGIKGLSITHYLIRFLHFIHSSLDTYKPHAVIAAFIDMAKAFNRVDHNLLIEDLFHMKCPPFLLRLCISFLSHRKLTLAYKGVNSKIQELHAGAPQGTLLGVIFFIVKFNGALLRPKVDRPLSLSSKEIKLKYMDDLSTAVSVNLTSDLITDSSERQRPLRFCESFKKILPSENNLLQGHIIEMENFAEVNRMKINRDKSNIMKFSRAVKTDFPLEVYFSNNEILEEISEIKLLGVFIENSLKWTKNTDYICQKARQRIWLLRNMKKSGLTLAELIDAYIKEVRSLLEMAVPVWHSGLTKEESHQIERVQKAALIAIIGQKDLS